MSGPFDGSSDDPSLVHALGGPAFDPQEQDELDQLDPGARVVLLDSGSSTTVTDVRDFNRDNSRFPLPPAFVEAHEALVEVFEDPSEGVLFVMLLTRSPDEAGTISLVPASTGLSAASAGAPGAVSARDVLTSELLSSLDAEDWPEIVAFLDRQILLQERLLSRLRAVASAHRDGVQNAVDTVQTKRLDFITEPEVATITGAVMLLVLEVALVVIPEAAAGRVAVRLATGLCTLSRRSQIKAVNAVKDAALGSLKPQDDKILVLRDRLAKTIKDLRGEGVTKRKRKRQKPKLERRASRQQLDLALAAASRELTAAAAADQSTQAITAIAGESQAQATRLVAALRADTPVRARQKVVDKLAEKAVAQVAAPPASRGTTMPTGAGPIPAGPIPIPIDIAMKMQVQDFFEGWLGDAELTCVTLKDFSFLARHYQVLPEEEFVPLTELLVPESELETLNSDWDGELSSTSELRARLETEYELLIWALMFFDMFHRGTEERLEPKGTFEGVEVIAIPPDVDRRLLRYLRLRFFPNSEGEAEEPGVKGAGSGLVVVLETMQDLVLGIEELTTGTVLRQEGEGEGRGVHVEPEVMAILRAVRIGKQGLG